MRKSSPLDPGDVLALPLVERELDSMERRLVLGDPAPLDRTLAPCRGRQLRRDRVVCCPGRRVACGGGHGVRVRPRRESDDGAAPESDEVGCRAVHDRRLGGKDRAERISPLDLHLAAAGATGAREPQAPFAGDRERPVVPLGCLARARLPGSGGAGQSLRQALLLAQQRLPFLVEHLDAAPRDLEAAHEPEPAGPTRWHPEGHRVLPGSGWRASPRRPSSTPPAA